jgi:hypothetical protein
MAKVVFRARWSYTHVAKPSSSAEQAISGHEGAGLGDGRGDGLLGAGGLYR